MTAVPLPPPPPPDLRRGTPLWRNLSFQLTWSSTAASGFGDRMIQLAALALLLSVPLADGSRPDASAMQGAIYFFFFLPYVLFGPPFGWVADTLPRKWILFGADELRALILLGAFLMMPAGITSTDLEQGVWATPADHAWKVLLIIFGTGVMAALFAPARDAMLPQIVPTASLQAANAIVLGIATIFSLIGFMAGGWIMKTWSVRDAVMVGLLCYAISGSFWAFLRPRPAVHAVREQAGQFKRLVQAAGYLRGHRNLAELFGLGVLFWGIASLIMGIVAALCNLQFADESLGAVERIAIMSGMVGVGMLVSSVVVALMNSLRESNWLAMVGLVVAGLALFVLRFVKDFEIGLAMAFIVGFFGNITRICTDTLIQATTPNYIRGRVLGLKELIVTLSAVLVNLLIWKIHWLAAPLRRLNITDAGGDQLMIWSMYPLATALVVFGSWGLWRALRRGPHPSGLANGLWRITRLYCLVWHRLRWIGRHRVPAEGPVILAANHTTGLDPFLMQSCLRRTVRWVMLRHYRFRVLEFMWRRIDPICLDKGASDLNQVRAVVRALKQGQAVGLFPEGALQRDHRELQPFQQGIALIARRSEAMVVPVWIEGTPRKRNMIWHFLRPSRSTVIFGQAYRPDPNATHEEMVADLRRRMLLLAALAGR